MTPSERDNPKIINGSRRKRIALGSGTDIQEVNRLIKQFDETRRMMKMMTTSGGKGMMKMMQNMQGAKDKYQIGEKSNRYDFQPKSYSGKMNGLICRTYTIKN